MLCAGASEAGPRLQLMVLGLNGVGKAALGRAVVAASRRANVELDVLLSNELPLVERLVGRVDYLVFMLDMKSKLSLERLCECVASVDRNFCTARSALVIVNSETPSGMSFSLDAALSFAEMYGMHVHYSTRDDATSVVRFLCFSGQGGECVVSDGPAAARCARGSRGARGAH